MRLSIDDINRRQQMKTTRFKQSGVAIGESRIYTESGMFCENNAINTIQNLTNLSEDTNKAFDRALDVFSELCLNAGDSVIRTQYYFLAENVDKVRDASALMNSIKYKNSRLKTKITTKISNKLGDVNNAISNSISNLTQTIHKGGALQSTGVAKSSKVNEQLIDECFNGLLERTRKAKECDRIVENYNRITNRYNIDHIIACNEGDIYQTVYDITECIDQFNTSFKARYNSALETAYYALGKHFVECSPEKIIEAVVDYFIFNHGLSESEIDDIKKMARSSVVFESDDFDDTAYLWQSAVTDDTTSIDYVDPEEYGTGLEMLSESLKKSLNNKKNEIKHGIKQVKKDTRAINKMVKTNAKKGNPEEHRDEEVKAMVDDFRKNCAKDKDKNKNVVSLKALVNKIFTRTPFQIVYELPSIFSIIRASFIVSVVAINPIIGILTLITDQCIKLTLERKQMQKIIDAYQKELETCNKKLESIKDDEEKERYTKYRDELKKDLEKLRQYDRDNYTEEENDERGAYNYDDDFDDDFDDFGLDNDDEWDDDFDEAAYSTAASVILTSQLMESISESLVDNNLDGVICDNILKLPNNDLDIAADFFITVPVLHEKDKLQEALVAERDRLRSISGITTEQSRRIDCLNDNIFKFKSRSSVDVPTTMKEVMCYLKSLEEVVKIDGSETYLTEMDFSNTLKLAMNNLKRGAVKLADKEKKISNDIDVSVNGVSKALQQSVMNGNREAVIKGQLIPSASKCIKLALGVGVAWAVNPAIAVIGAIGTFACMKKMQNKERQLVLDDIEIELKMCERYIHQAEDKNDLKKVRELEKIQRNLERQHQRIKYKMNVEHDMRVPDSTAKPKGLDND